MKQPLAALHISDAALLALLKKAGKITADDASLLQKQRRATKQSIQALAVANGFITERGIAKLHVTPTKTEAKSKSTGPVHLSGPKLLDNILKRALSARATVVHIEPRDEAAYVRLRVNGLLQNADHIPSRAHNVLLAHLKTLLGKVATNHHAAQQGMHKITIERKAVAVKIAIVPTETGEKITLQITPLVFAARPISALGYWGASLEAVQQSLARPRGLQFISGPHYSGTSTTFLSALQLIASPSRTITTLEDSVGQRVAGLNQTAMFTHGSVSPLDQLSAMANLDPDTIGIDRLHDPATIAKAVQVAAGGRLVIATIAADSSAQLLARLINLGIEPYVLATAILSIANQRLARRLCDACKQPYRPSAGDLRATMRAFDIHSGSQLAHLYKLEKQAAGALIEARTKKTARLYRPSDKGCIDCRHTGYNGFIGLQEVLSISPNIQKLILAEADAEAMQRQAERDGMVPLRVDALIKVLLGLTNIEEALRVL